MNASEYQPISLLSTICKLSESINNKWVAGHLNWGGLLNLNQYGFHSARTTADDLTVITYTISKGSWPHIHHEDSCPGILKAFDNMWRRRLLHKLSISEISGNALSIIKSFLTSRSLKVIINSQSSDALNINTNVSQGSHPFFYYILMSCLKEYSDH